MIGDSVQLRPNREDDAYMLWLWANDPETRSAAFDRPPIGWAEHQAWFSRLLADGGGWIGFVKDDLPIGSIRFDSKDQWKTSRLSYVVAPEARGSGYGKQLVELGVRMLRSEHPRVEIVAEVRAKNAASLKVFRALGWVEQPSDGDTLRFLLR